ncbi:hypothetical protein ACLKA7_012262 [Drosophila subpalustris]
MTLSSLHLSLAIFYLTIQYEKNMMIEQMSSYINRRLHFNCVSNPVQQTSSYRELQSLPNSHYEFQVYAHTTQCLPNSEHFACCCCCKQLSAQHR